MENTDTLISAIEDDIQLSEDDVMLLDENVKNLEKLETMICSEAVINTSIEQVKQKNAIPFTYRNRKCNLIISKETKIIDDQQGNRIYALFRHFEDAFDNESNAIIECECDYVLSERDGLLFDGMPINKKARRVETFCRLLPSQREYIRIKSTMPKQSRAGYSSPIIDEDSLIMLFEICGETYPPDVQIQAELIIKELREAHFSQTKFDLIKRLSYLLNGQLNKQHVRTISYDEIISIFDKRIYGMKPIKRVIAERIMLLQRTGKALSGVLIEGNPGVGKSSFAESMAECYGLPLDKINCDGADPLVLKGLFSSWAGAKPGEPARLIYQRGTDHVVLLIEEIDKLSTHDAKGDLYSVLNTMLADKTLHDEFVGADMPINNCIIVATCNDLDKIPGYIKDRFSLIFKASDLSVSEKVVVGRDYIIPELFKENQIGQDELVIDDEILEFIAKRYCDDFGARKMKSCIETIMCSVVSDQSRGIIADQFKVTQAFVIERLDDIMGKDKKIGMGFAP